MGIDLGTSGVRAIVINQKKEILAEASIQLPESISQYEGWFEQNPMDWWTTTIHVLQQVTQKIPNVFIKTIAVDGTSGTVLLCDKTGDPLYPALMYNDIRATKEAKLIKEAMPDNIAASASSSLAKVYWLEKNRNTSKAYYILHQADWIANKLTGCFGYGDQHNALKCGFNPMTNAWDNGIAELPLNFNYFPHIERSGCFLSNITKKNAILTGLSPETSLVYGTTDSTAGAIASGINEIGDAITSLGSSLVMKILTDKPYFNNKAGIYSHCLGKNKWLVGGASNAGGKSLTHYFSLAEMEIFAKSIKSDQKQDLKYYPLTSKGERFPINDPKLSPIITPRPEQDNLFYLALIDGLVDIEKLAYQELTKLGLNPVKKLFSIGGGTKNKLWQARRKRNLEIPLVKPNKKSAAYGSAIIALTLLL